jgi:hypothetical protein
MPTNNPKISAYVPQVVYDRFEQFRKESGLSMSQSAIVIFAKYFGLEDIAKGVTGGITTDDSALDRIKALESQVDDLFKKFSELENKSTGEPSIFVGSEPEIEPIVTDINENILGELLIELPAKKVDESDTKISGLQGELLKEPPVQINPIKGKTLAKRLISPKTDKSITTSLLSTENQKSFDHFYQWTMDLDIDNIGWEFKGRSVGYIPVGKLSSELHSKLLRWIQENS